MGLTRWEDEGVSPTYPSIASAGQVDHQGEERSDQAGAHPHPGQHHRARQMQEHGIGDDMDGLLNFMDEEKVLDPFLSWLGWFTNLVIDKEEGKSEEDSEESKSIIAERNDVIKQALIPTLVNIIRHARMQEHGPKIDDILDYIDEQKILDPFLQWLPWFSDMILTNEEGGGEKDDDLTQSDEEGLELEVLEKEESMEERMKKMEEEEDHAAIPQEDDEKLSKRKS